MTGSPLARYEASLAAHLGDADETLLHEAYAVGREAANEGVGVVDLAIAHHAALAAIVGGRSDEARALVERAEAFFVELLSPYEMLLSGYRESNARLVEANRRLSAAKAGADAANRELESFSYSVAHDLRAPLRSIDGFSLALVEDYGDRLDEEGRHYLDYLRESAQQMAQLIDDLLALSRVTRSEFARAPVDLAAIARDVIARLRERSPGRRVETVLPDALPVEGDARLLGIAFANLIGNSWKFTAKTDAPRIEIGVETIDGETVYHVRDNGAGFDMAFAAKLFGVFQRLHSTSEFEGTGIGLATVQRIVHRHGGRIWAEGAVGAGAVFRFTLGGAERTA